MCFALFFRMPTLMDFIDFHSMFSFLSFLYNFCGNVLQNGRCGQNMSVNTRIYGEHYCRYDSVIHSVAGGGIYQCDDLIPWNSTSTSGGLILKS
jgi:hypothetical protein